MLRSEDVLPARSLLKGMIERPKTSHELCRDFSYGRDLAWGLLGQLLHHGLASRVGNKWAVTEGGRQFLDAC